MLTLSVALVACGNTADPALQRDADRQALGLGSAQQGDATGSVGTAPGATATVGPSAAPLGVPGATTGPTGGPVATTGPSAAATQAAASGDNGGAVDVGVTATSITVGNVSDLSGPVPGLFQGAVIGTQAYFAKVNSEGGVYGRQLKVAIGDGQLDCGQNKAVTTDLASKVFAFVGSFSLYDDCGSPAISANPNLADVHSALGSVSQHEKNNFSIAPLGGGWRTGPLHYYKQKYGAAWQKIGAIYANVGASPTIWRQVKEAIASTGGKVVSDYGYGPSDTDFTATVVRMQRDGVQMIYATAVDGAYAAKFVNALRSQHVSWPIIFGGSIYDTAFLTQAGANAEGVFNDQQYAQFFNADDAAVIPAVAEFQKWTEQVGGKGVIKDLYSVYGWSSAQLFVQALRAAGPKAKRGDLLQALRLITSFNADGLIAAANPAGKQPATCWILTEVKGAKLHRVDSPQSTFRCDGSYYRAKS